MKRTITTLAMVLAATVSAAAADIPSKTKTPAVPAPSSAIASPEFYAGINLGGDTEKARVYSGGVVAGYNAAPFLAVEATYDLSRADKKIGHDYNYKNTFGALAVPKYKVMGTDFSVYGLGGVGYQWNTVSTVADHSVYNLGGGVKYEFAKNLEVDTRYRRIDAIEKKYRTTSPAEDRVTAGVNYKF